MQAHFHVDILVHVTVVQCPRSKDDPQIQPLQRYFGFQLLQTICMSMNWTQLKSATRKCTCSRLSMSL
jgi:hypothetical protein